MKLHSIIIGEGSPLLILHGFLGMSDNWKTLGNQFAEAGYEVHLIDQRNHGRSPHSEEFDYLVLAKDIKEYCDSHGIENCALLGHSMGGKTAMFAACLFPHVVDKLIVVDIAPKYYTPHHDQILKGLKAVHDADFSSRDEADKILSGFVEERSVRLFLLKNLYRKTKDQLALRLNLDILIKKTEVVGEELPPDQKYSKPTLFMKGEKSGYIKEEDKNLILRHFPAAEIVVVPKAGHWVHAENRKAFYTSVMSFL